jgi:hydrogenase expression/formation protein HypC
MCLGIPAQLVDRDTGHPDLAAVDVGGVTRVINMALLDEPLGPGDWVLVHMGFALSVMTAEEARDALDALGAEREAEDQEAASLQAASHETVSHETADRETASRETASHETAGGIR